MDKAQIDQASMVTREEILKVDLLREIVFLTGGVSVIVAVVMVMLAAVASAAIQ